MKSRVGPTQNVLGSSIPQQLLTDKYPFSESVIDKTPVSPRSVVDQRAHEMPDSMYDNRTCIEEIPPITAFVILPGPSSTTVHTNAFRSWSKY